MFHSTVTKKGQTTIPSKVRAALNIKPGDRIGYQMHGDSVTIQLHPKAGTLAGSLASDKGRHLTFDQIRRRAAKAWHKQPDRKGSAR